MLRRWDKLPSEFQCDEVRKYYDILSHRKMSLFLKRIFDLIVSLMLVIALIPILLIISIAILLDSRGGIFFRQTRVTKYGKKFKIIKFRTMMTNAEKIGPQVTVKNDMRVTRVGKILRKYRLDELPQLFNIITGDMTFVGTRPEVVKYVEQYTQVMKATLLLPAGVTSEASIYYKDENKILDEVNDADKTYLEDVLPEKMYYNLKAIENFTFLHEIKIIIKTVLVIFGKEYIGDNKNEVKKDRILVHKNESNVR